VWAELAAVVAWGSGVGGDVRERIEGPVGASVSGPSVGAAEAIAAIREELRQAQREGRGQSPSFGRRGGVRWSV